MSVDHLLVPANEARHPSAGLCDALLEWRDADWTSTSECRLPERRTIDANRATVELAESALMRRFGLDRIQAFSLMVRWARLTHTPVHRLARTLAEAIGEADPQTERRHHPLIRWLEGRFRLADLWALRHPTPPIGDLAGHLRIPASVRNGVGVRGHHSRS